MFLPSCTVCGCLETSCEPCTATSCCSSRESCCCSQAHRSWKNGRILQGLRLEYLSTAWMSVEVVGGLSAGILASSFALVAFGSDSLIELFSGLAVLLHLRKDSEGSASVGRRTALVSSLLLFLLIPTIAVISTYSFFVVGLRPEASPLGLGIAVGAVVLMPVFWLQKKEIGRETKCLPLAIDALESATCFLMSIALLGGLAAEFLFGIGWADYVATFVILAFVGKEAVESYREVRQTRIPTRPSVAQR